MIAFPAGARVWIAGGVTDMRCGMNSLALKVQQGLGRDPHGGEIFCFRGRKGDLIKVLWHDGVGMSLYLKRLEAGKFIWPVSQNGWECLKLCVSDRGHAVFRYGQAPKRPANIMAS